MQCRARTAPQSQMDSHSAISQELKAKAQGSSPTWYGPEHPSYCAKYSTL